MKAAVLTILMTVAVASSSFSQSLDSLRHESQVSDSLGRDLAIKGVFDGGAIKIRWATGNTSVWTLIRQNGVILSRQESREDSATVLNNGLPLRIWNDTAWQSYSKIKPGAAQAATLLKRSPKDQKNLSDYSLADLEQNRLTSLLLLAEFDFGIAQGLALAYVDSNVTQDGIYRYQISIPDSIFADTLSVECFIAAVFQSTMPPIYDLSAVPGDGAIYLSWARLNAYSGYLVERTKSGAENWERLTSRPLLFPGNFDRSYMFSDSVTNYVPYRYRVIGVDAFERLSSPSEPVEAMARDLTPPQPPFAVSGEKKPGGALINWKNPPPEPDLAGYGILKSVRPDDEYMPVSGILLSRETTSYFDSIPDPGTYFYRLVAADTSGNVSVMSVRAMVVVEDTIPPAPPSGLEATADTTGAVFLLWQHNMENDVKGYRVYRMITAGSRSEYLPLTPGPIVDSSFVDTLMSSLRDNFLYYVKTVDFAGNYSDPCPPVGVRLPDIIAPARPVFEDYSVTESTVTLSYLSPSRDVKEYRLRRFRRNKAVPEIDIRNAQTSWDDTSAVPEVDYYYTAAAVDSSGNESDQSKALFIKAYLPLDKVPPPAPQVRYSKSDKSVEIKWEIPRDKSPSVVVFRKRGSGPFQQLSPQIKTDKYKDKNVPAGVYQYAIKFYYKNWGGTPLSGAAELAVPEN